MNHNSIRTVQICFTLSRKMPLYTSDLFLAKALSYTISVEKASSAYDRPSSCTKEEKVALWH